MISIASTAEFRGLRSDELSLDRLKRLEGDWVKIDENGQLTDKIISAIRVTAGGNAVGGLDGNVGGDDAVVSVLAQL